MVARLLLACALLCVCAPPTEAQNPEPRLRRECDVGELSSCALLGLLYETGAAGVQDLERALELYRRACEREVAAACTRLALAQAAPTAPQPLDGRVRTGYVADAQTGEPVAQAVVELPRLGIRVVADDAGRVDLGSLPDGTHRVMARRLGYESLDGELPVPWETPFLMLLDRISAEEEPTLGGVIGRVMDEATGQALAYVDVALDGVGVQRVITGADGRFAVQGLEPGSIEVTFELLGYAPRSVTIQVDAGETLEVRATLAHQPIELAPIEVFVGSPYLDRSGFYRRTRMLIGTQFTRGDLDDIDPLNLSDVMLRAPGVMVVQGRGGARLFSSRQENSLGQGDCRLRPYLDGIAMYDWDIDYTRPDDLEAIEIYHGPNVPVEYKGLIDPDGAYPCGVVLIWTRRGR